MTATADKPVNGIMFYDNPLKVDRYEFLYDHLDCDSIIKRNDDYSDRMIDVIACALKKEFNGALEDLFYSGKYKGKYVILRGIDSREANSID